MRKLLALPVALFYLACHAGAAVLPAEKLLPDDTLVMFTVPDYLKVRDIYQNSPQGRLWNDPAMKEFKDKFMGKLMSEYVTPLERDLGVHFNDYTNLPQGQFTLALVQNGWQGKETQSPAWLFLLDTKTNSNQLKTNLLDLKKKWVDAGKTIKTEKIRDVDFSVVVLSRDDLPKSLKKPATPALGLPEPLENPAVKNEPKKSLYIGQAESLLIIGDSAKVIEKILARLAGGSLKTLSEIAAYDANTPMFHDAPAYGWVNIKAFVDVFSHPSPDADADASNPFAFKPDKILAALGVNSLQTVAFNYQYSNEGAQFNLMLAIPEANRAGLFKILAGEAKDYNPPVFVPADAVKFQRWRIDGQKTWATVRKMLGDISPASIGGVDLMLNSAEAAAKEKDPAFDLKKNLFGNLGDDFITYQKSPKGATLAELSAAPSIFMISSPNPEQLAGALKNISLPYYQPATPATDREFLGHKIYSIPLPAAPGPDGAAATAHRSLNYACSGGYLVLTSNAGLLEEYLRSSESQAKALRDTPGLSDAASKVAGSGASLFGYSNESESMRVLFETLKKNPSSADPLAGLAPILAAMGMTDIKVRDWLDVSLLPPYEKVSKYFYFTVYGGSGTADGLHFKAFAPVPPQLKK